MSKNCAHRNGSTRLRHYANWRNGVIWVYQNMISVLAIKAQRNFPPLDKQPFVYRINGMSINLLQKWWNYER